MFQELTLRHLNKPLRKNVTGDIEWICDSLGLCTGRDIDRLAPQVVTEIVTHAHIPGASSEFLAGELGVAIARINHHLRNLTDRGLVRREKRIILLRGGSMQAAVQELRRDTERVLDEIELIASEVDESVGLKRR